MAERERLESLAVPDAAAAEERAWAIVSDAYAHRRPRRRRSRAAIIAPLVVLVVAAAVAAAVAATPQGATVATWIERTLGISKPVPRSSIGPLPAGGRLLVTSRGGAFVVASDGSRTRLGDYTGATWSPHGLFIGAWRGRRLSAVAPDGRVAWSYLARGRVRASRAEVGDDVLTLVPASASPLADEPYSEPVVAALAALPPEQRAVIVLRHLLGYTPGEIGSLLELPRGTVNSRLRRGLDALALALAEER